MKRFTRILVAALAINFAMATVGLADTEIGDDVEIDAKTGFVVTVAFDSDAKAVSNIASVLDDTKIGDDFEAEVLTEEVVTLSIGPGTRACTHIGSVGAEHACE